MITVPFSPSNETWWLPELERWIRMGAQEAAKITDDLQTTTYKRERRRTRKRTERDGVTGGRKKMLMTAQ
jgi:hypothetical protein